MTISKWEEFEVIGVAKDGIQAVELSRQLKPDLLVMDMQMPKLSGPAAVKQIRGFLPEVRVLALTTFDDVNTVSGALEAGCSDEVVEKLSKFGETLGIMFQLRDDLIDFLSDSREEGKETHKDFRDGIYTMPVLKAMQQDACRQELLPLMRRSLEQDLTPSEIGHMEETVKRYGGVDATRGQIRSMQETCYALLDGLEQNNSVSQLRKLVRYLSI